MVRLLMSAVGGDVACATLRALKKADICDRIIGFDMREANPGLLYVDEFFTAPAYTDVEMYGKFVFQCCSENGITHFWPITETEILWANEKREEFGKAGITLVINNEKILETASSKYKTASFLRANGIMAPYTVRVDNLIDDNRKNDNLVFPAILKNDFGCGSHDMRTVHSRKEFERIVLSQFRGYVIQEYVESDKEYTVGVFSNGREMTSIAFKRRLGAGGMSVSVETVCNEQIDKTARKVADIFHLDGSINIQMKEKDGEFYVFEINPRVSSTVGFRALLGHNDAAWWLDSKAEHKIKPEYKAVAGKRGVKLFDDLIIQDELLHKSGGGIG